ncbi:MAG: hypothetical protein AAF682_31850 [Planctomycetota bacterium]
MIELSTDDRLLARYLARLDGPACAREDAPPVAASEQDRDAARYAWALRAVDEYRSVVVFGELLALLAREEAPLACTVAVQQLLADELRHTRLCLGALARVDPACRPRLDLAGLGLPPSDAAPLAFAFEVIVREIVVAEAESVVVLRAYRDATTDPFVRGVLQELLRDEVRHAAAGRSLATALARVVPAQQLAHMRASLAPRVAADIRGLRSDYRDSTRGGPGRALGASLVPSDLGALPDYRGIDWCWTP